MNVIAVINQKGGVGKSTTALAVGAGLRKAGKSVLFVDLDPQGNLTYTLKAAEGSPANALNALLQPTTAAGTIQSTEQGDAIAAIPELANADAIITQTGKEYRLREALEPLRARYDYVIIDTPPALGILTINALTACTGVIIPAQADVFSVQGVKQLYGTIQAVKRYCNPNLRILGIVLTRYNARAVISRDVADLMDETAKEIGTKLYGAKIRECTALKEAQAQRMNIYDYAPKSNATADYTALTAEILKEGD